MGGRGQQPRRRRIEVQRQRVLPPVQGAVAEGYRAGTLHRCRHLAALRALMATHLEEVGKIGRKIVSQRETVRLGAVVLNTQPLEAAALPDELFAQQVDDVLGEQQPIAVEDVWVGEIDRQQGVVVLHRGTQ